jgi:hypothetical protein
LIPQIIDEASVDSSVSVTYVRRIWRAAGNFVSGLESLR